MSGVTPYVVAKNDTHISIGIAWTVNSGDSKQVICFNATDSLGYVLMHCTNFNVYMYTLIDMKPNTLICTVHIYVGLFKGLLTECYNY